MRKRLAYKDAYALKAKALEGGATPLTPFSSVWNVSGDCAEPVAREFWARPSWREGRAISLDTSYTAPISVALKARCRKCDACLRFRGRHWAERTVREMIASDRSWFITLTISNATLYDAERKAIELDQSSVFAELSDSERLLKIDRVVGKLVTKYFKVVRERLRAEYGRPIKLGYIAVMEPHPKRGMDIPHYHAILCTYDQDTPLKKHHLHNGAGRFKKSAWKHGFWHGEMIERSVEEFRRTSWYVAKYVSKYAASRVRASLAYGHTRPRTQHQSVTQPTPQNVEVEG